MRCVVAGGAAVWCIWAIFDASLVRDNTANARVEAQVNAQVDASSKLRSIFFGGYTSIDVYRNRIWLPTLRPRSAEPDRRFHPATRIRQGEQRWP
jgi:hypothetical protein